MAVEILRDLQKASVSAFASGGAGTFYTVVVNFANRSIIKTNINVAGTLTSQLVVASPSLVMPSGVAQDELEMDMIAAAACVTSNGVVKIICSSVSGVKIAGSRNINLWIG